MMLKTEPSTIRMFLFMGGLLIFLIWELLAPYRHVTVSKLKRWIINLAFTGFNNIILSLLFAATITQACQYVSVNRLGILNSIEVPYWQKILITILILDFMLYIWHLLNHVVPFFWDLHRVHHCDLNMDVSTATRFHIGELAISKVITICLILFLGVDLYGLFLFETLVIMATQFHHSSLKIPVWFEKIFWILFVPPSMHRIHHSVVIKERDSNYGIILSVWDRILGTLLTDIDQTEIRIGVGRYQKQEKLNFHHLLIMPLTRRVR